MKKKIRPATAVSVAVLLFFSTITVLAYLLEETIPASGASATAGLRIYSNSACTQRISSISWGNLKPGGSIVKTVFVKNTGSTPLTLHLAKTHWAPDKANGPITITWNRENVVLYPNRVTTARITLTVLQNIQGISTFSVDIVIRGVSR